MIYQNHIIEEIRESNDLVDLVLTYIDLKQKGNSFVGLCPFHNENTPSFTVTPSKQLFHCFGCGAAGNVYSFVMQMENYSFYEAIKFLAERINYTLPENDKNPPDFIDNKKELYEINKISARFFYDNLISDAGRSTREYLKSRGLTTNICKKFGLGYSLNQWDKLYNHLLSKGFTLDTMLRAGLVIKNNNNKIYDRFRNRLMFPIFDSSNKVVGFGGRALLDEEPKYLNSPETAIFDKSKNLYGINFARLSRSKELLLVEGYMDVISLYQGGFANGVASLGTAFNDHHARALRKYADTIIIIFDNDKAGSAATLKAIKILQKNGLKTKIVTLNHAKDPDEYLKKFSKEDFLQEILNAKNHMDFQIDYIKKDLDLNKTEDKIEFVKQVAMVLKNIKSQVELEAYIEQVSAASGISALAIKSELSFKEPNLIQPKPKKNLGSTTSNKGLDEAKKNILCALVNFSVYNKVSKYLEPKEMIDQLYINLLEILYNLHKTHKNIKPADIISNLPNEQWQQLATPIFLRDIDFDDKRALSQAITDQIRLIKKAYIDIELSSQNDIENVKNLINIRRNVENLHISLLDG